MHILEDVVERLLYFVEGLIDLVVNFFERLGYAALALLSIPLLMYVFTLLLPKFGI